MIRRQQKSQQHDDVLQEEFLQKGFQQDENHQEKAQPDSITHIGPGYCEANWEREQTK